MACEHLTDDPRGRNNVRQTDVNLSVQLRLNDRWFDVPQGARGLTIGSGPFNDVVIKDRFVSRVHCRLSWQENRLILADEGSCLGTWANGHRVTRQILKHDVDIVVGRTTLTTKGLGSLVNDLGFVGEHERMRAMYAQIRRVAACDSPVLVSGESGTGKEIAARAVHQVSKRAKGPFEVVNCAAISRDLAESELFGHRKGAFTGANDDYPGLFVRADGGTLFLDEVGELPLELQAKLLRVLEEGRVRPLGAVNAVPHDVRLVTATNRPLEREVEVGGFRFDLFQRIAMLTVDLPPLRHRLSDLQLLIDHLLEQIPETMRPTLVTEDFTKKLEAYHWPGNVRELRRVLLRAAMSSGPVLTGDDLGFLGISPRNAIPDGCINIRGRSFAEIRNEVYCQALRANDGNRSAAARSLGVAKSTFCEQVRRYPAPLRKSQLQ